MNNRTIPTTTQEPPKSAIAIYLLLNSLYLALNEEDGQRTFQKIAETIEGEGVIEWMIRANLIDGSFKPTARGRAWIHYIRTMPLPEPRWVIPGKSPIQEPSAGL